MATKVFISWSGDLSRKLGAALRDWLPASLQYVKPYFSPEDIQKGSKWNTEIAKELESSDIGVICLTLDNTENPWILFEAGALSKSIDKSRVCTLLFDIEPSDIKGPLTSFQSTRFVRDDFRRLISTVNNAAGEAKLDGGVLENVFDMWWPRLEEKVKEILATHDKHAEGERRSERDILEEILEISRMNVAQQGRPSRISGRAVMDLIDSLDEIMFLPGRHSPEELRYFVHRVDRPLRHICMEAGTPKAYERHRINVTSIFGPDEDPNRASEKEDSSDS